MEIHSRRAVVFFIFFAWVFSPVFAAEIRGKISVKPPFPEKNKIEVVKKVKDSCSDVQYSQELIVSPEGGLKNAVVFLKGDFTQRWPEDTKTPELDQQGCVFSPHVFIVPTGVFFKVKNSDPVAHDIRSFQEAQMLSRFEMSEYSQARAEGFKTPGIYVIRCGFHPWMYAFAVSAPHPFYAVSDEAGQFTIANVPEGDYVVKLWHETLGEAEVSLKVGGAAQDFSFTFENKP